MATRTRDSATKLPREQREVGRLETPFPGVPRAPRATLFRVIGFHLLLALAAVLFVSPTVAAQPSPSRPDEVLTAKLRALSEGFEGDFGFYVRRLSDGREATWRADETFPTASLVKVPLLLKLCADVGRGRFRWTDAMAYDPARISYDPGDDLLAKFKPGESLPLERLAVLMVSFSDNHASLWIQDLVGGGAAVNEWLAATGLEHTRVNSRVPGREEAKKQWGWGQTTPREMAEIFVRLHQGGGHKWLAAADNERALRLLTRSHDATEALAMLPPGVQAASKQGAVDRSRSEAMLVFAPHGPYVFCLITKNQRDERYTPDNVGWELLRRASKVVWEHFESEQ